MRRSVLHCGGDTLSPMAAERSAQGQAWFARSSGALFLWLVPSACLADGYAGFATASLVEPIIQPDTGKDKKRAAKI